MNDKLQLHPHGMATSDAEKVLVLPFPLVDKQGETIGVATLHLALMPGPAVAEITGQAAGKTWVLNLNAKAGGHAMLVAYSMPYVDGDDGVAVAKEMAGVLHNFATQARDAVDKAGGVPKGEES